MKKWIRTLKILLIIFIILSILTTILISKTSNSKATVNTAKEAISITNITVDNVGAVALRNEFGKIGIITTSAGVSVLDAPEGIYSSEKLSAFIYYFAHLNAINTVQYDGNLYSYGLDKPNAECTLILSDGSTIRLVLGAANPLDGAYYLLKDDKLYLVEAMAAEWLTRKLDDFRDFAILPIINDQNIDKLLNVAISSGKEQYILTKITNNGNFYTMTAPLNIQPDWQQVENKVLIPLANMLPDEFVADGVPLSKYGLDKPNLTISITMDNITHTAYFAPHDARTYYCTGTHKSIFLISKDKIDALASKYTSLLSDSLYSRRIAEIHRIVINDGRNTYSMDVAGEGAGLHSQLNGKALNYIATETLFRTISTIPMADKLEHATIHNNTPSLTLLFALRNGDTDEIMFYPYTGRQSIVAINGKELFTTYNVIIADIIAAIQAVE